MQDVQAGLSRNEALKALADRTKVDELRHFVLAVIQADKFGVPIARVLRVQAAELRIKRRQRAEEKAMKLPVKIIFPLVFFILPVVFIVLLVRPRYESRRPASAGDPAGSSRTSTSRTTWRAGRPARRSSTSRPLSSECPGRPRSAPASTRWTRF